jgi:hypothetical protein
MQNVGLSFTRTKQSSPFLAASGSCTRQYLHLQSERALTTTTLLACPCTSFVRERGLCAASFSICTPHFHSMLPALAQWHACVLY